MNATKFAWEQFQLATPPHRPGIYAIRSAEQWMYVGRSIDVARRVTSKTHPAQITRDLHGLELTYWWFPCPEGRQRRTENSLIRSLQPEWNGGTTVGWYGRDDYWQWVTDEYGRVTDDRVIRKAQGPCCSLLSTAACIVDQAAMDLLFGESI